MQQAVRKGAGVEKQRLAVNHMAGRALNPIFLGILCFTCSFFLSVGVRCGVVVWRIEVGRCDVKEGGGGVDRGACTQNPTAAHDM